VGRLLIPFGWETSTRRRSLINLVAELFALLAEPDCQGELALADHLGGADWWDEHRLGYGVVTTVASLQHWASRLKMVASVAKCLLGERSLQFFRFRGPRCVGQRDLYPFAIFFRELPVERHEELIGRAMRWPDPLAEQVARVVRR
jgi:hypothetical protein